MKKMSNKKVAIILIILALFICKATMMGINMKGIGSFETERKDILARRDYLSSKLLVQPHEVINAMPSFLGEQFQGEVMCIY